MSAVACRSSDQSADLLIKTFGAATASKNSFQLAELATREPAQLRAAALRNIGSTDPAVHHAAVQALVLTVAPGAAADQLRQLMTSANPDDRLLAAGALAGTGESAALPVLIAGLHEPARMLFMDPPQYGYEFARASLLYFTTQDFGLKAASDDAQAVAATEPAWTAWWRASGSSLRWDPKVRKYK
jgi:hypothetical protein